MQGNSFYGKGCHRPVHQKTKQLYFIFLVKWFYDCYPGVSK